MTIHETAFLTCAYRSSDPELSGDHYAYLYNNARTDDWVDAITAEVSDKEPFLHCLRNRFFLDKITDFFGQHPEGVLVNWGSGFSMYPFLIAKTVQCIDIDQNDIISYKSDLLNDWIKKGKNTTDLPMIAIIPAYNVGGMLNISKLISGKMTCQH